MSLMQWDESMSVGVEELDAQHQQLISMINDAYEAILRHDEHLMAELIDKMRDYAMLHFECEEAYLERYGFPDLEEHKALHEQFNTSVNNFRKDLYERTNLSQIFVYLSRWLTSHIMDEDRKYSEFIPKEEKEETADEKTG